MKTFRHRILVICTLLAGLLAGCSSTPPSRLYLLEPLVVQQSNSTSEVTVAVARVTLPEYLKRAEILTRVQRFRINAAAFDRWAEPLDYNTASVLSENLSRLIPAAHVLAYPWDSKLQADYSVHLRVINFSSAPSGEIELGTSWIIFDHANSPIRIGKTAYRVTPKAGDVIAKVEAMSLAVEQLSQDIAIAIKGLDNVFSDRVSAAQSELLDSFLEKRLAMHRHPMWPQQSYQPVQEAAF